MTHKDLWSLVDYQWGNRLIHDSCDPFHLFCYEPCHIMVHVTLLLGLPYEISISTLKSVLWVGQFYLFPSIPTGAVLFVSFQNKWSSSFCSDAHSMAQFYLFWSISGGAVLFVPAHIKWSSSTFTTHRLQSRVNLRLPKVRFTYMVNCILCLYRPYLGE